MQLAWRIDPRIEAVPISSESYEKDTWLKEPLIVILYIKKLQR
jgi:hypothetical protein